MNVCEWPRPGANENLKQNAEKRYHVGCMRCSALRQGFLRGRSRKPGHKWKPRRKTGSCPNAPEEMQPDAHEIAMDVTYQK